MDRYPRLVDSKKGRSVRRSVRDCRRKGKDFYRHLGRPQPENSKRLGFRMCATISASAGYGCWISFVSRSGRCRNHRPLGYEPNRTPLTRCDSVGLSASPGPKSLFKRRVLVPNWCQVSQLKACREFASTSTKMDSPAPNLAETIPSYGIHLQVW